MDQESINLGTFVNIIPNHNGSGSFILFTEWDTDGFKLSILLSSHNNDDEETSHQSINEEGYIGEYLLSEFDRTAELLEMSAIEFRRENQQALCTDTVSKDFQYELIDNEKFIWRKVKESDLIIQYGSINLIRDNNLKNNLLLQLINLTNSLKGDISNYKSKAERLQEDYDKLKNAFETSIQSKDEIELELLTKFNLLLNTKKAKIAELQEILEECSSNNNYKSGNNKKIDKKSESKLEHVPDSKKDDMIIIPTKMSTPEEDIFQNSPDFKPKFIPKRQKPTCTVTRTKRKSEDEEMDYALAGPSTSKQPNVIPEKTNEVTAYDCDTQELFNELNQ